MYHRGVSNQTSIGQRKRQFVRDQLSEAAMRLLAAQGYEATTIEQIAEAVGISRRTFFRYFQSKEDVIVAMLTDSGNQLAEALAARPESEPPSAALRRALDVIVKETASAPEKTLSLVRAVFDSAPLHARYLEHQMRWRGGLTEVLARRAGADPADLLPDLAAGVALSAFHSALSRWIALDGAEGLAGLLDRAFAVVGNALDAAARPTR